MNHDVAPFVRLILHRCGSRYTRVTFRRVFRNDFDSTCCTSAELWTWFRHDRRWELVLVVRGATPVHAAQALLDEVLDL